MEISPYSTKDKPVVPSRAPSMINQPFELEHLQCDQYRHTALQSRMPSPVLPPLLHHIAANMAVLRRTAKIIPMIDPALHTLELRQVPLRRGGSDKPLNPALNVMPQER